MSDTKQMQVEVFSLDNNEFQSTQLDFLKQHDLSTSETIDPFKIISNSTDDELPTKQKPKIQEFHNDLDKIFADFDKEVSEVLKESPSLTKHNSMSNKAIEQKATLYIMPDKATEQNSMLEEQPKEITILDEPTEQIEEITMLDELAKPHQSLSSQSKFFQAQDPSPLINNKKTPQRISIESENSHNTPTFIYPLDTVDNTQTFSNTIDTTENTTEFSSFLAPEDIVSEYIEDDSFDPLSVDVFENKNKDLSPSIQATKNSHINFSDIITTNNKEIEATFEEEENSLDEVTIDDILISDDDEDENSLNEVTIDDILISDDDEDENSLDEVTIDDILISDDGDEEDSLDEVTIDDIVISDDDEDENSLDKVTIDDIVISDDDEDENSLDEVTINDIVISDDDEDETSLDEVTIDDIVISDDDEDENSLDEVTIDDIVISDEKEEDASSISKDLLQQLNQSMPTSSSYLTNLSKDDISNMMKEIDNLLEFLPDEKIEELAHKDFYHTYIKFLDDLGI